MSENLHIHDSEDRHVGDICMTGPCDYQVAVHRTGARKWEAVGERVHTITEAFADIGAFLDNNRRSFPKYNRAGIWAVERGETYYAPEQVYEVAVR